ncbi:MAG: transposase [Candidatus Latescibacteria bacterium]|nr:transposase [Candidatus Latescibacterota bacterium]
MDVIRGVSRDQATLFPERLDDYIDEENPVRFIDVFVDDQDMKALGFQRIEPAWTGRRPYDPRDLLKLYIYGYLNQIRSSRKLERETHRNVEVMWLLRRLCPDHKTIANFRKDNPKAFKEVFLAFTVLCRQMSLFGGELIAVDGSKFKAVNSPHRNFTKDKLKKRLQKIEQKT